MDLNVNIKSDTLNIVLNNLFGAIKSTNDTVFVPWLTNKRLTKYDKYTLETNSGELMYFENGTPVIWNTLDSKEQMELIKFRNMNTNGKALNDFLTKYVNKSENKDEAATQIMNGILLNEEALLYYTEKAKYISTDDKVEVLASIIAKKLSSEEEISTEIFDIISNLTKNDILALKEIKSLCSYLSIVKIIDEEEQESGFELVFPCINGDYQLEMLNLDKLRYSRLIEFSMKNLFSATGYNRVLQSRDSENNLQYYMINYGNQKYIIDSVSEIDISLRILSSYGKEILYCIELPEDKLINYEAFIKNNKLLGTEIYNVTDISIKEAIDLVSNK